MISKENPKMDKNQFISEVKILKSLIEDFNKVNDKLSELFGSSSIAENAFLTIFYKSLDKNVEFISSMVGDKHKFLDWYLFEVIDIGTLECAVDGKTFYVNNEEDLWEVINYQN